MNQELNLLQFTKSSRHNVAVLVVVNHFSKFVYAQPNKDKTSKAVAAILEQQILPSMVKTPNRILTDNGPEFRAKFSSCIR